MFDTLLSHPFVVSVRRNHALEHATIHMLSRRPQGVQVVGRSTWKGFILYGDLPTADVRRAAQQALQQLRAGQQGLAVHPACGTNFVAGGLLAGLGAFAVLTPRRRSLGEWLGRFPTVVLVVTLGLILGQRLGALLQARVTTEPRIGDLQIVDVTREERGALVLHHVRTSV
ncbi:MAG: hypothetical protein JW900_02085 [Anaerolineae bacterium]|nr:hypothetical protein [Anaerolineae bacterium]